MHTNDDSIQQRSDGYMQWVLHLGTLLLLTTLIGCSSSVSPPSASEPTTAQITTTIDSNNIDDLITRAERRSGTDGNPLRLRAAEIALDNSDLARAQLIIDSIIPPIKDQTQLQILQARLSIGMRDASRALALLRDVVANDSQPSEATQLMLARLRSQAYLAGRSYLASARELIYVDHLINGKERGEHHERIFAALLNLSARRLKSHAEEAITSGLRGWLSLASLSREYENDPMRQLQALENWGRVWRHHPAASQLPKGLATLSQLVANQPRVIAVMLPLSGEHATTGRAVLDGILATHFAVSGPARINVVDTATGDIRQLVANAAREGAELLIGPLLREHVTTLAQTDNLPVPVLALNRTSDNSGRPDLYQFGLAPEDEMRQIAHRAWQEGHRNVVVISPASSWGERNTSTFTEQWLELGGNLVASSKFEDSQDYSGLVKNLLKVDQSEQRATELRRITGERFQFTPRRRQDLDFVLLLANPSQSRSINPTLAFFYAEDIPVYSSSHVYQYADSRINVLDLNGIRFCDIPWKLNVSDPVRDAIESQWESAKGPLTPFYALGVDAYRIYPRLQQMKEVANQRVAGTTGVLKLNQNNAIERTLMWARFRDGKVIPTSIVFGG